MANEIKQDTAIRTEWGSRCVCIYKCISVSEGYYFF